MDNEYLSIPFDLSLAIILFLFSLTVMQYMVRMLPNFFIKN